MIEIPLTQNKVAFIDDANYELVSKYKWCAAFSHGLWYAVSSTYGKQIKMHRLIMKAEKGQLVDHKNRDGLDNRLENLRFCTVGQNRQNQSNSLGVSKYQGVWFDKKTKKWAVRIQYNKKKYYFGEFNTEEEAARIYDNNIKKFFGEFAKLNF